jgi:hypothetical protein
LFKVISDRSTLRWDLDLKAAILVEAYLTPRLIDSRSASGFSRLNLT